MKQSQYVVHNRGLSQILFATPWSVRSIFKHVIVVSFIAFITIIAFDFNTFRDALEGSAKSQLGNATGVAVSATSIVDTAKLGAPQIVWDILLIFLEVRILRRTLKMLQTSNRNMWVFIPFALLAIALGAFVATFLTGWMQTKLLLEKDFIDGFKMLSVFMYIYMIVPGLTIIWSLANAINERRISPFVARANILTSVNMVLWLGTIGCAAELAHMLYLGDDIVTFDLHSPLQSFLIIMGLILLIVTVVSSIWSQHDMRRKTNYKFFNKNIGQAISLAMVIPLTIWLCSSFMYMNGNWMEYVFIALVVIVSISSIVYGLIRRTESGSPRVFIVIVSLLLTIIWMGKFFFEYFGNYNISTMFTIPVAMIGTSVIVGVIYWKSPMTSKFIQFLFARFIKTLWIVVVVSILWTIAINSFGGDLSKAINKYLSIVSESLNILSMALPILLLAVTLFNWYVTQWKIKSHITYKTKRAKKQEKEAMKEKENKKDKVKEAANA